MGSLARRLAALTGTSDPDVAAWLLAGKANGGFYTAMDVALATAFVAAEKASGAWYLTDDYRVHWVASQVLALTSLKKKVLGTAVGSPVHTPYRDFTTNGLSSYINTNFVPATDAGAMTINSNQCEVYERTNSNSTATAIGVGSGSSRSMGVVPRQSTIVVGGANSANANFTLPSATSVGLTQIGRGGSLATDTYGTRDGVDMVRTVTPGSLGASLPVHALVIGGYNNSGTIAFRAGSYGYVSYGAALDSTQRPARFNAVKAWGVGAGAA